MEQQPQPQPTMHDVMSEIEAARVIEQELNWHRKELRRYEQQFDELQRLKEELRQMASRARSAVPDVPDSRRSELDQAMHAVVVALNQHAVMNSLDGEALQPEVEELAQEFLVEALLNIARHSEATESNFSIKREESWLFVSVFDNGKGNADPTRDSGLSAIRTRVDAMGGHFSVSSPPNRGTLLTLAIPCLSDR